MKRLATILALAPILLAAGPAAAQQPDPKPAPPPPCGRAEAALFDFWLGDWDVEAKGRVVGRNRITKILGGCTLLEEYSASGGAYEGKSFNYFDSSDSLWHQVWVDNGGTRLHLAGGFADGMMVMSGERAARGQKVVDRISWTDNPDGTVRQLWELSKDKGATWKVLFDGLYRHPGAGTRKEGE
jgi:hypothetical protein